MKHVLMKVVSFVNEIHAHLGQNNLKPQSPDDCTILSFQAYQRNEKILNFAYDKLSDIGINVQLLDIRLCDPQDKYAKDQLSSFLPKQTEKERKVDEYLALIEAYPKLTRKHEDYAHEILYSRDEIFRVQGLEYDREYKKALKSGKTAPEAALHASRASQAGIVFDDGRILWLRDALVIKGENGSQPKEVLFNRLIWRCDLDRTGGVCVLPFIEAINADTGLLEKKYLVIFEYRHSTGRLEASAPRGGSFQGETEEDTARREGQEETGANFKSLVKLCDIATNTGMSGDVNPIYLGEIEHITKCKFDETERIIHKEYLTYTQIMDALRRGYMDIRTQRYGTVRASVRDGFLHAAIGMAHYLEES
jgi:hypothetical protein